MSTIKDTRTSTDPAVANTHIYEKKFLYTITIRRTHYTNTISTIHYNKHTIREEHIHMVLSYYTITLRTESHSTN